MGTTRKVRTLANVLSVETEFIMTVSAASFMGAKG